MAHLENLGKKSLSDLSVDEAHELLRQIRLSRRTQKKKPKKSTSKTKGKKKDEGLTAVQAKKLLEILGG